MGAFCLPRGVLLRQKPWRLHSKVPPIRGQYLESAPLRLLRLPELLPDDLLHQLDVALAVADVDCLERSPGI